MAKKSNPSTVTHDQIMTHFLATTEERNPARRAEKLSAEAEKSRQTFSEIGCKKVRIWGRTVEITGWRDKNKSVEVIVGGEKSCYNWPFKIYNPFQNLEILEDCGYLERFANGHEYVIEGKRYGVKDDAVWAGGKRYLTSEEKVKFGSFQGFLKKHPGHQKRPAII